MPTRCEECAKLRREFLGALDKVAKLAAAQAEAFREGEESMSARLDDAVQIAIREKQRAAEVLLHHREGHG